MRAAAAGVALLLLVPNESWGGHSESALRRLQVAWDHAHRDEWEQAASEASAAAALLRKAGGRDLPEALEVLGTAEVMLGHPGQAADHLQEGIAACGSCDRRRGLRFGLASAYRDLGRFEEAESLLRELLAAAEAAGSRADQALSFKGLAGVAVVRGRRAEALPLLQEALRREGPAQDRAERAGLLESIGVLLTEAGDGAQALELLPQAEVLHREAGDAPRLLRVGVNIAEAHAQLGQYDTALAIFVEVEAASRRVGDENELARSLNGSAEILRTRGRLEEAEKRFEEALAIAKRSGGGRGGAARAFYHLAQIDLERGHYDRAFSRIEEALGLTRAVADQAGAANSLLASGGLYSQLSRDEEGLARLLEGAARAGEIGGQNPRLAGLVEVVRLFATNRLEEAIRQSGQLLALARQAGTRRDEAYILRLRASLLFLVHRWEEEGRRDAEAALALSRELGDRKGEALMNFLLGFAALLDQRYDEARAALERSLAYEREIGSSGQRAVVLWALGAAHEKQWNYEAAIAAYREAVEVSEAAFGEIRAEGLLAGLAEQATRSYGRWLGLLARQGDVEQAFAVAERSRARTFLRRLGNPPPASRGTAGLALAREEAGLRRKLGVLTEQLRHEQWKPPAEQNGAALAAVAREIDGARRDYETLLIRLQQANPEYASLAHPSPLTVPEVQKLLDGKSTLIEYFLLDDATLAWVIDRDSVHLVRLALEGDELTERVEELRQLIATRQPIAAQASLLYLSLFHRLVPHIEHTDVIIVPHGALQALPFSALTPDLGRTWLAERYSLRFLPSASVLPFLRAERGRRGDGILVLGDPDGSLPAAAAEARAVAALYGTRPLLGREASAAALRDAGRPIAALHISAHAAFEQARPLFSRIRLADGDLAVHDIFGLDLDGTDLVVLSGCETGVGQATEVGDLESLSRAFLYAGASSVVATLWAVDDLASRSFMEAFYRRLRDGMPTAEALRQAQLEILRGGEEWRHPFYWAAFTLTGSRRGE